MKKLLTILLLLPVIAFSKSDNVEEIVLPAVCVPYQVLNEVLTQFSELPALRGNAERQINGMPIETVVVIYLNPTTKSWTIVEKMSEGKFCVLVAGNNFQAVPKEIVDQIMKERDRKKS